MSGKRNQIVISSMLMLLVILACNMPGGTPPASETPTPQPIEATATATETPAPIEVACAPSVTTTVLANVRNGPGQVFDVIGNLPQGASAKVAGRSQDGQWWYIEFPAGQGGYAWISITITAPTCIPSTLAIIAGPPTPVPTNTSIAPVANSPTPTPTFFIFLPPGGLILYTNTPTPNGPIFWPPIIINP
jgi:uncharacterized protein YraI